MGTRAALFCHNGLGDGIVSLVLSHQLSQNGWEVDTYHNLMREMQDWVPHLPIFPYPSSLAIPDILRTYDWVFVVQNDACPFIKQLIVEGKRHLKDHLRVFYFYPSKRISDAPYYHDTKVDPSLPIAQNLGLFCKRELDLSSSNPLLEFTIPPQLSYRDQIDRVAIHAMSSRAGLNWPLKKYVDVANWLEKKGFQPVFVVQEKERAVFQGVKKDLVRAFDTLKDLSSFIYESGYFIGNNSGPGHLASSLGVPTVTVMRRKAYAKLWAPSFSNGVVLTPPSWIPNIRGLRLRDRYWQRLIFASAVKRGFARLCKKTQPANRQVGVLHTLR